MGGLGLRRCEEHASGAYAASFFAAKEYMRENWHTPYSISSREPQTQHLSSLEIDTGKLSKLLDMTDPKSKKHLEQLQKPHAMPGSLQFLLTLMARITPSAPLFFGQLSKDSSACQSTVMVLPVPFACNL